MKYIRCMDVDWCVEYTPIVGIDGWNEGGRDRDGEGEVERGGKTHDVYRVWWWWDLVGLLGTFLK